METMGKHAKMVILLGVRVWILDIQHMASGLAVSYLSWSMDATLVEL